MMLLNNTQINTKDYLGRFVYEEYLSGYGKMFYSGMSLLRNRIGLTAQPYKQVTLNQHHIVQEYPPTLPQDPNFLDEETKEEFMTLQVNIGHEILYSRNI